MFGNINLKTDLCWANNMRAGTHKVTGEYTPTRIYINYTNNPPLIYYYMKICSYTNLK